MNTLAVSSNHTGQHIYWHFHILGALPVCLNLQENLWVPEALRMMDDQHNMTAMYIVTYRRGIVANQ